MAQHAIDNLESRRAKSWDKPSPPAERCVEVKTVEELKASDEKQVIFGEAELIEFAPECAVMPMPETEVIVHQAIDKVWEDIDGMQRETNC